MKKIIALAAAVLVTVATTASAGNARSLCESINGFARAAMAARQNGVEMVELLRAVDTHTPDEPDHKMLISIVRIAYSKQRYSTESMQQRAITDFTNETMSACLDNLLDQ